MRVTIARSSLPPRRRSRDTKPQIPHMECFLSMPTDVVEHTGMTRNLFLRRFDVAAPM